MKLRFLVVPALALLGSVGAGCSSSDSPGATGTGPTYATDIAPLVNEKCTKCHQAGGIGPFALTNYQDVSSRAALIATMTRMRAMPPYLITHDGSCGNFEDGDALSDAQIQLIQTWAQAPLEGGTSNLTPPAIPTLAQGTDIKTPMVTPVAQGGMLAQFDDYRCFPIDTALSSDKFVTGYDVIPGRPEIVHHVVAYVVDPTKMTKMGKTNGQLMQDLEAANPDAGWSCFGGAGEGIEEESSPVVWAPGQGVVNYPDKMGARVRATDKLVVQIHYNLADPKNQGLSDSTTVRVRYADQVERPLLFILPDGLLETLFTKKDPDTLRPGMPKVSYTWQKSMKEAGLPDGTTLDLVSVTPHMHQRGKSSELRIMNGTQNDCAARIDNWNFHWQKAYFYKGTRPTLTSDSQIQLTCDYDTSADHDPVYPGWGTRNEMCLDVLVVAPRM